MYLKEYLQFLLIKIIKNVIKKLITILIIKIIAMYNYLSK